ncbi:MAG: ribonuclease H-like domain-containing protein [Nitrospiraceae bacterium]|nr:ribonuclease H-like domain-containing protein [Nitrospiraceae bacterium]
MSRLVFDIETYGLDFDSLDQEVQDYLLKSAETPEDELKVRDSLGLFPVTAEVVAIGMLNPDTNKGAVYFQTHGDMLLPFEEEGIKYECGTEKELLEKFWAAVKSYDQVITFNGRSFDAPFLAVRSAVHRIRPSVNLIPNRYDKSHIDLFDQLSFYGVSRRRFSLDMWCRTFGIQSPKAEGISGQDVRTLYKEKKFVDIARYCARDVRATKELFSVWESFIKPPQ